MLKKYEPKTTSQILGNQKQVAEIIKWLGRWKRSNALLVTGPTGSGKSIAIRLVAKHLDMDIVESHGDDERNKAELENMISMSRQQGVFARKKLILIEDIDVLENKRTLGKLIEESSWPVVFTADSYVTLPSVVQIKFQKVKNEEMFRLLKYVCSEEGMKISDTDLNNIVKSSDGDVRAALIDITVGNFASSRSQTANIFNVMKAIFSKSENAKKIAEKESVDTIMAWVDSNILQEHKDVESIAAAYDALARADMIRARIIKRQSWSLQKYILDTLIYGMPRKKRITLGYYQPPTRLRRNEEILEKIAGKLHISKKEAAKQMTLFSVILNEKVIDDLEMDEDDVRAVRSF
ncbi:MAG: AAA family ATPase [Candidatus Aenigmarchaeota archaeon]|nr:AAA family ATPase [Candidatus Aenigmarchaeota archaeon]